MDLYDRLLTTVARSPAKLGEMCLFPTSTGSEWSNGLLICGRAPNGYSPSWSVERVASPAARADLLAEVAAAHPSEPCPMRWVSAWWGKGKGPYNTARSAFWRVSRTIAGELDMIPQDTDSWPSHLAWANLYRIAPAAAGNPDAHLQRLQLEACKELLTFDLERLRPRGLLLMTGSDWAHPFVERMNLRWNERSRLVEGCGTIVLKGTTRTSVVVAKHPQGKPHAQFVREVVEAFRAVA